MLRPLVLGLLLCAATAHGAVVFSTDFEAGLPDEFTSPGATIEPVQGFAGLGTPGNQFAGSFLRYADGDLFDTALTLTDLPVHDTLTLGFLLAVIDSWDGTELLEVTVDDVVVFSHSFELATADTSSYVPPEDGLLSSGTDLGFSAGAFYQHDRAYDLSVEPAFTDIPHSADSVTIVWRVRAVPGGAASFWQGGADESWAIDDVTVEVSGATTTTTSTTTSTSTTTLPPAGPTTSTPTTTSASTTTLPADECAGVPVGPTFPSIVCRLATELARVQSEHGLGGFQPKLAHTLRQGRDRATEASDLCAANTKRAKGRLKQVERAVIKYAHRLSSTAARRKIDEGLRAAFLEPTGTLRTDVKALREAVLCP